MANGERCKHCGQQETDHMLENQDKATCDSFESEFQHTPECPALGCDGDCQATIAQAKEAKHLQQIEWEKHGG